MPPGFWHTWQPVWSISQPPNTPLVKKILHNKPVSVVCMLVCMNVYADGCVCVSMCVRVVVCMRGARRREKKYDISLLRFYDNFVECFIFLSSKLIKGWLGMCCLKEINLLPATPPFLRTILKEFHFSDVSSQHDKPAKYICIILGIFYW